MLRPTATLAFGVCFVICVFAACNGGRDDTPTAPMPPPTTSPPAAGKSEWKGDMTLMSCSGCNIPVGHTFSDTRWHVELSGSTIVLDREGDWEFKGTMDGRRFVATYPFPSVPSPDQGVLQGEFAEDFNSFEVDESQIIPQPPGFHAVYHHRVVRIQ